VIVPIFEASFLPCSFANRKGYGTHRAFRLAKACCRRFRYVLKCDVKRYFPSIDREILKEKVRGPITDPDTLWLIETIIDGESGCESFYNGTGDMPLFDSVRKRGIPIGNLTSQVFANVYLDSLDHFVCEGLGCREYLRYVDDFVLCRDEIAAHLRGIRLVLHEKKHSHRRTTGGTGEGIGLVDLGDQPSPSGSAFSGGKVCLRLSSGRVIAVHLCSPLGSQREEVGFSSTVPLGYEHSAGSSTP
jgi:hypothetical protein